MDEEKTYARLDKFLNSFDKKTLNEDDFLNAFEKVTAYIKSTQDATATKLEQVFARLSEMGQKLEADNSESQVTGKKMVGEAIAEARVTIDEKLATLEARVDSKIADVRDGKDADEETIIQTVLSKIPPPKEVLLDTPDQVVEKVNKSTLLIARERVDGLLDAIRMASASAVASMPITTNFFNGLRGKNLNIVGGTATQTGDTVNVVVGSSGMTNPMTTGGDIIYGGASGVPTRLANGSATQVLTSQGTTLAPIWTTLAGSGDVSKVGTPVNNQIGVWTGDGTIEGDAALTFDTSTDTLATTLITATTVTADLVGNVTGNVSGTSGSTTGNAASVTVADAGGDTTTFPLLATDATGSLSPRTDAGLTYNANTNALTTTTFVGALTGNASTASAVAVGGITGLGTNVATALAVNVGSAGAFITFNGDAGTPSALVGTNLSGTGASFTAGVATLANTVASANEATDTTCFILFQTASGTTTLATKNNTGLTYNSNTNAVGATTFVGALTGTASGNLVSGGALGTPSSGTGTNITGIPAANILAGSFGAGAYVISTTLTVGTSLLPDADDGAVLGGAGAGFSDLFLAEGAVINWDSSDATITQTGNILAVAGADLRVATAGVGTDADSVPTLSSTSTLTNKTLTSPTLTTPSAFTTGGTITLAENTSVALDPAGSADGKWTGITVTAVSGYTAGSGAFGDLVYLAVADSRWEKTDADALATAGNVLLGMMLTDAPTDGSACNILLYGIIRADAKFPALTVGAGAYVGETAGAIQVAIPTGADNIIRVVGFALTADEIMFNPSQDWQVSVA